MLLISTHIVLKFKIFELVSVVVSEEPRVRRSLVRKEMLAVLLLGWSGVRWERELEALSARLVVQDVDEVLTTIQIVRRVWLIFQGGLLHTLDLSHHILYCWYEMQVYFFLRLNLVVLVNRLFWLIVALRHFLDSLCSCRRLCFLAKPRILRSFLVLFLPPLRYFNWDFRLVIRVILVDFLAVVPNSSEVSLLDEVVVSIRELFILVRKLWQLAFRLGLHGRFQIELWSARVVGHPVIIRVSNHQ